MCPSECPDFSPDLIEPVCANNEQTYKSECEMRLKSCEQELPLDGFFYGPCPSTGLVHGGHKSKTGPRTTIVSNRNHPIGTGSGSQFHEPNLIPFSSSGGHKAVASSSSSSTTNNSTNDARGVNHQRGGGKGIEVGKKGKKNRKKGKGGKGRRKHHHQSKGDSVSNKKRRPEIESSGDGEGGREEDEDGKGVNGRTDHKGFRHHHGGKDEGGGDHFPDDDDDEDEEEDKEEGKGRNEGGIDEDDDDDRDDDGKGDPSIHNHDLDEDEDEEEEKAIQETKTSSGKNGKPEIGRRNEDYDEEDEDRIDIPVDPVLCSGIGCPIGSLCKLTGKEKKPYCDCDKMCERIAEMELRTDGWSKSEVCGTDGKIYANECLLRRESCLQNTKIDPLPKKRCSSSSSSSPSSEIFDENSSSRKFFLSPSFSLFID